MHRFRVANARWLMQNTTRSLCLHRLQRRFASSASDVVPSVRIPRDDLVVKKPFAADYDLTKIAPKRQVMPLEEATKRMRTIKKHRDLERWWVDHLQRPDTVAYNAYLAALCRMSKYLHAREIFFQLKYNTDGFKPDLQTFVILLRGVSIAKSVNKFKEGLFVFKQARQYADEFSTDDYILLYNEWLVSAYKDNIINGKLLDSILDRMQGDNVPVTLDFVNKLFELCIKCGTRLWHETENCVSALYIFEFALSNATFQAEYLRSPKTVELVLKIQEILVAIAVKLRKKRLNKKKRLSAAAATATDDKQPPIVEPKGAPIPPPELEMTGTTAEAKSRAIFRLSQLLTMAGIIPHAHLSILVSPVPRATVPKLLMNPFPDSAHNIEQLLISEGCVGASDMGFVDMVRELPPAKGLIVCDHLRHRISDAVTRRESTEVNVQLFAGHTLDLLQALPDKITSRLYCMFPAPKEFKHFFADPLLTEKLSDTGRIVIISDHLNVFGILSKGHDSFQLARVTHCSALEPGSEEAFVDIAQKILPYQITGSKVFQKALIAGKELAMFELIKVPEKQKVKTQHMKYSEEDDDPLRGTQPNV